MGVKNIFKVLIGTIVIIVVSFFVIELMNISTSSMQLNHLTKMSAKQASVLFSQETYKTGADGSGASNIRDVVDANGSEYVSGKFYSSTDPRQIYNDIYNSDEFREWLRNEEAVQKGNWKSLSLIDRAINKPDTLNVRYPQYHPSMSTDYYDKLIEDYGDAMLARLYRDVMMTPLNMGVPYLDQEILTKMFRWNLAELASNCNPNAIKIDDYGNRYVVFNGFRVYADRASIIDLEYKTFDLTQYLDRIQFRNITNIDPDNLYFEFDRDKLGNADDERQRVALVGIKYSVPVAYEGITPIRRAFDYVWSTEVDGLNGSKRTQNQSWSDVTADLTSGGFDGTDGLSGVLPVPGKLIYYVIR